MIKIILRNTLNSCTYEVIDSIKKNGLNEGHHVVIIPDAHSLTAEKVIFDRLNLNGSMNIEAVSFTRLARKVLGNDIGHTLSKQGAVLFFKKVINKVQDKLCHYKQASKTDGFAGEMYAVIASVRNNAITEAELEEAILKLSGTTCEKAEDIKLLYKEYMEELKAQGYSDSTSRLDRFKEKCASPDATKVSDSYFYIYGFDSLSKKQIEIIATLAKYSKGVTIGLAHSNGAGNKSLYPDDVVERLKAYLEKDETIKIEEDSTGYNQIKPPFNVLHDNLFNLIDARTLNTNDAVTVFKELNSYEQYNAVAREIVRLIRREKGLRYKDIAIIDCEERAPIDFKEILKRYNVPVFMDERYSLTDTLIYKYLATLFDVVRFNNRLDKVRAFIKSPLFSIDGDIVSGFENYILANNLNHDDFYISISDKEYEELRIRLVKQTNRFANCKKVSDYVKNVRAIISEKEFEERFNVALEGCEENLVARNKQAMERLGAILDEYEKLIPDEEETTTGFIKTLASSCEAEEIALIPHYLDAVYVSTLRESCIINPKVVFVLNATYFNLPSEQSYQAIISSLDMGKLEEAGLRLYPTPVDRLREERFAFIDLITKTEKLYIGYPETAFDGTQNKPSQAIKDILEIFSNEKKKEPISLNARFSLKYAKTLEEAILQAEDAVGHPDNAFYTLLTYPGLKEDKGRFDEVRERVFATISPKEREVMLKKQAPTPAPDLTYTFRADNHTSISQIERYFSCPYSHYLQYGLRVNERKEGVLRLTDVGTIVHSVMELYFKKTKGQLRSLTRDELETYADKAVEEVFSNPELAYLISNPSVKFLLDRLKRESKRTALDLTDNVLKGEFEPTYFELSFGSRPGQTNSVVFDTKYGKISFHGKIDRVDVATLGSEKVAIAIDYKTGSVDADLNYVYYGSKVQLYLYLIALKEGLKLKPGGSFYLPIKSGYTKNGRSYRFQGQFVFNNDMIKALDTEAHTQAVSTAKSTSSDIIPLNFTIKNGVVDTGSKKNKVDEEGMEIILSYLEKLIPMAIEEMGSGYIDRSPLGDKCERCYHKEICGGAQEEEIREMKASNSPLKVDLDNLSTPVTPSAPCVSGTKSIKDEVPEEVLVATSSKKKSFTEEQLRALDITNKNMLVSASAGSGKTTVMVERILEYLKQDEKQDEKQGEKKGEKQGEITSLIILTFTKASANDMREKITEKLASLIRRGDENAEHYRKQLSQMPFAYIGTIDSVCGQIYKRYFEVLGGSPVLEMMDKEESNSLRAKAIDAIFNERILEGDADFNEIADLFSNAKSFDKLRETIEVLLNFLSAQEYPDKYLEFALEEARTPLMKSKAIIDAIKGIQSKLGKMESLLYGNTAQASKEKLLNLETEFKNLEGLESKYAKQARKKLDELNDVITKLKVDPSLFCEMVNGLKMKENMPNANLTDVEYTKFHKKLGALNTSVKKLIEEGKELFSKSLAECEQEDKIGQDLVLKLIQIVKDIRQRHIEYKLEENKNDFEDVERKVLRIFENEKICGEFSKSIKHIFCDEFQDTNRLQEAIFTKIANHNRYLVGDLKQAIYGFREADSDIFQGLQDDYDSGKDGDNRILSKNFRSSQKILTFVDDVFSEIMTPSFGGVDYANKMRFGKAGLPQGTNGPYPVVEGIIFTPEKDEGRNVDTHVYSVKNGRKDIKKEYYGDRYIADKISAMVGSDLVADKEGGVRPIKYSDICILYRSKKHVGTLTKLFDSRGIPYVAEGMEGKSGSRDIDAINSYLCTIDNYKQDKHLVCAMLSYMGGFNEEELAEIRKNDYESEFFHNALDKYISDYDDALAKKVKAFFDRVNGYKQLSALVDVPTLIGQITTETGYISALMAEGKTARIATYNSFIQTLRTKRFAKSLQAYVEFLESGVEMELPTPSASGDAVTIMTIHRSKGLEFPVVFVARMDTPISKESGKKEVVLDSTYGIGVKAFDSDNSSSKKGPRRVAIEKNIFFKQSLEELRLMYVAFTRAKYRLYLVGNMNVDLSPDTDLLESPADQKSFMGWVAYAKRRNPNIPLIQTKPGEYPYSNLSKPNETRLSTWNETSNAPKLEFGSYRHSLSTAISNKYTVTGINSHTKNDEKDTRIPSLGAQSIQKGVAYHKVMELIDFNLRLESEIKDFVSSLEKSGTIEKEQVDALNVCKGINHALFDLARKGKCLREQEFIYYAPASIVLSYDEELSDAQKEILDEDRVLIQGVMDLVIEGEENVLIDYKVSDASESTLRARYRTQIELYAKAYEEMTGRKIHKKAIFVLNRGEVVEF